MKVEKHFVEFYSPGTLLAEIDQRPIDSWDIEQATEMARSIHQRHRATPYAFRFLTFTPGDDTKSPMYYLGGEVQTLAEVKAENSPDNQILIANMECNGWNRIITNRNSWRTTRPLGDEDVVLDFTPEREAVIR